MRSRVSLCFPSGLLQIDEDVLEARHVFAEHDVALIAQRSKRGFESLPVMAADMQQRAEERHMFDSRLFLKLRQQSPHVVALDDESDQARLLDDVLHGPARDDPAQIDVDNAIAALRLV